MAAAVNGKVFDCMAARIPVIALDFPPFREVVDGIQHGMTLYDRVVNMNARYLSIRRRCQGPLARACVAMAMAVGASHAMAQAPQGPQGPSTFHCGGPLEKETWRQWDQVGANHVRNELIGNRLVAKGDAYALYDFEIYFHNLLAMAQRCGRTDRQQELARLVSSTYQQLVQLGQEPGRGWLCRGGHYCGGDLRNREVMLYSSQYMAFATSLANGMLRADPTPSSVQFGGDTARIAKEHLLRWSTPRIRRGLQERMAAKPEDVKDGSSYLFLHDRDLWQISIFADYAGLVTSGQKDVPKPAPDELAAMKQTLASLLRFFALRTSVQPGSEGEDGSGSTADVDVGYWRRYADNRYAGYTSRDKPVVCRPDTSRPGMAVAVTRVGSSQVPLVNTVGWDVSHARRLVHFFDAIERNREAMVRLYGVRNEDLPSRDIMAAFARQLRIRVWNQNPARPLFANYYDGTNGWFRVNYDNGSGECNEGYPPFGMSDSFPTGGYAAWGTFDPPLQDLGRGLYWLMRSGREEDKAFIDTYYSIFGRSEDPNRRHLAELGFWPSLIGTERPPMTAVHPAAPDEGPGPKVRVSQH